MNSCPLCTVGRLAFEASLNLLMIVPLGIYPAVRQAAVLLDVNAAQDNILQQCSCHHE